MMWQVLLDFSSKQIEQRIRMETPRLYINTVLSAWRFLFPFVVALAAWGASFCIPPYCSSPQIYEYTNIPFVVI